MKLKTIKMLEENTANNLFDDGHNDFLLGMFMLIKAYFARWRWEGFKEAGPCSASDVIKKQVVP